MTAAKIIELLGTSSGSWDDVVDEASDGIDDIRGVKGENRTVTVENGSMDGQKASSRFRSRYTSANDSPHQYAFHSFRGPVIEKATERIPVAPVGGRLLRPSDAHPRVSERELAHPNHPRSGNRAERGDAEEARNGEDDEARRPTRRRSRSPVHLDIGNR